MRSKWTCLFLILISALLILISCSEGSKTTPLFDLLQNTGIDFSNNVKNTKDFNIFTYRNFYNGGGVAIGDINNDGLADVFFTANMGSNKLYLNKGNWQFEDISDKAGFTNKQKWSTGVVFVDINSDGWLDIYVCNAGYQPGVGTENELYINNRHLNFTESAKEYGLAESGYTTHAAFFDYDLDGDLDAYILKNSFIPVNTLNYANTRELRAEDWPVADFLKGGGDKLLKNNNGKFVDVSKEANIYGSLIGFGLGVTVGDINNDHYPDLYISNDFFERDYLYINQKNGVFKEELEEWMQHVSLSSMGADIGDINNDGYTDIFTTDMLPYEEYRLKTTSSFDNIDVHNIKLKQGFYYQFMQNTLQVNNGNGKFLETGYYSGVAASDWSWGGLMFDADNDGLSDIYVCNGIYHDVTDQDFIEFFADEIIQKMVLTGKKEEVDAIINKIPSQPIVDKAFKNLGNLKFSDAGESWGFTQASFSNGAAYGDLDNDGDLDLVVNNLNEKAFVYRNNSRETSKHNYIAFSLKGNEQNTFAIGSTIKVYVGGQIISREIIPSRGFQSSVDYKAVIGLGNHQPDSVTIIWPDHSVTKHLALAINQVHVMQQPGKSDTITHSKDSDTYLLDSLVHNFERHQENDYVDFYNERNIPMMISREGPKAAYGDVNGDGLEDVYIGGAAMQGGQLYLRNSSSGFVQKKVQSFDQLADFEDVAVLFFDCDQDGDLDLFAGSGGNSAPAKSRLMQNRLYRNDGKGNFEADSKALPLNQGNTSVVIACDFDSDNDQDLFVGGRCVPNNYGVNPSSYLLVNDGTGKFIDIAKNKNPDIANIGLVTGAAWADIAGDKQKELVIVGEWMAPRIFSYDGSRFKEVKSNLNNLSGWWQTIATSDLDGDGDQDLLMGNIGENFYLKPDEKKPVKLWINDFDENNTIDKIITRTVDGKDVPVFLKRELTDQIPSLKKQNLKHKDFASKSIQDLFPSHTLQKSLVKIFNYPSSCIAFNQGQGKFTVTKLPPMVQLSSVNASLCTDINGDGSTDIVLGGNNFGFLPQFSRLDASFGHVLLNDGKGDFKWIENRRSGLDLRGEIRDIKEIGGKQRYLLVLQNNSYPALYAIKNSVMPNVLMQNGKK